MGLFSNIFGDWNTKEIRKIEKTVAQIEALDAAMQALSDAELRAKTDEFKARLANGQTLDDILVEAFAVCREAAVRSLGMKHFHVQLIGGIVLHNGNIAEMKTGEGKTLVATLPVYLNALAGKGVHVVTVNDYLAKRDMEWMGKLYSFLGLTVGCVIHGITPQERRAAYQADVTYGTNNEFGFDYLRDNMAVYQEQQMQRPLNYAIVDEVDSILIDEARTPLIISGMGEESNDLYQSADRFVRGLHGRIIDQKEKTKAAYSMAMAGVADDLDAGYDYALDEKEKTVTLTAEGVAKAEKYFGIENFADPENMEINHHVQIALKAHYVMKRDVDYVEKDGEIIIVDEFTGRLMFGRRYSDGLHQAIEAKEGIKVQRESKTLATITIQNYFRMYQKLAGMTGTAKTEEEEFEEIYNMQVLQIPPNKPVIRNDLDDSIYATERAKFAAIVRSIEEHHATGQPVLVGTISVEKSEILSAMLKKRGIPHNVLNAKQHMREAEIVAQAGRYNAVTIATNMAGRGTDIILGGNPEFEARKELSKLGYTDEQISYAASFVPLAEEDLIEARAKYHELLDKIAAERRPEQEQVKSLGGLHIIGSERHESRRIDNQLRGRSGRQGDPGSSQFFVALEDDLMRLFGGERVQMLFNRIGVDEDQPLEAGILSRTIENAQKKVESRNYATRKYVLQYDDVMNKQRSIIYGERNRVLHGEDLRDHVHSMLNDVSGEIAEFITAESKDAREWDFAELARRVHGYCPTYPDRVYQENELAHLTKDKLQADILAGFEQAYEKKEAEIGPLMREIERMLLLRIVDSKWMDHIDAMDQLKTGIGLRAYGQMDPARAYANEGMDMFELMIKNICDDMIKACFNVTLRTQANRRAVVSSGTDVKREAASVLDEGRSSAPKAAPKATGTNAGGEKPMPIRVEKKPGRNDPCPCGSGKKYKNCHGRNENSDAN